MVDKKKITTEFPPYCIMDGEKMAIIKIAGMSGIGSNNGCIGCGIYTCFGNKNYERPREEYQKEQIEKWNEYISKQ